MRFLATLAAATLLATTAQAETIRVGVTAGPHAEIMDVVKKVGASAASTSRWSSSPTT